MKEKSYFDWSNIDGALPKAKRVHLDKDEADSLYFDKKPVLKAVTCALKVEKKHVMNSVDNANKL